MALQLRTEVLSLYKRILRTGLSWQSASGSSEDTSNERDYILNEAKTLFRKNTLIRDETTIKLYIQEAEARLGLANHYRIPYPRPVNLPQTALPHGKPKKTQARIREESKPIYIKSYDTY
ncbi:PREDICTED: LYR motif-containing protein 1-like [Priapulus caudatus]|uniref:LYR motif-containing protein 1-like n=1 Tax=Priapulus caudatus TaxID=37621 RepID=A0ABM1EFZ6_PRICU|nr:PREDICTED: LYR motif-containing protein 1-like [Priapulus caudatus]